MKKSVIALLFGVLVVTSFITFANTPIPIAISSDTENHAYGMSFCADNNALLFDSETNTYKETVKTSEMFPQCVYTETVPVYSLPPQEIIGNPEIIQFTGEITGYTTQTFVDLDCLQQFCTQIVNLDQNTGHVISLWQKE
ncbi:MAG: hypothetical protein AABX01_01990 [Candidatus Micrarchaeota archaeon]